jgi:serine/threonine-protein kinase HipA
MRKAIVNFKGLPAGIIEESNKGFIFRYDENYLQNPLHRPISITLPKQNEDYESPSLFPVFYNMLPEGSNKEVLCRNLRIDENDFLGLLLATAQYDSIGAITITPIHE